MCLCSRWRTSTASPLLTGRGWSAWLSDLSGNWSATYSMSVISALLPWSGLRPIHPGTAAKHSIYTPAAESPPNTSTYLESVGFDKQLSLQNDRSVGYLAVSWAVNIGLNCRMGWLNCMLYKIKYPKYLPCNVWPNHSHTVLLLKSIFKDRVICIDGAWIVDIQNSFVWKVEKFLLTE